MYSTVRERDTHYIPSVNVPSISQSYTIKLKCRSQTNTNKYAPIFSLEYDVIPQSIENEMFFLFIKNRD